MSRKWDIDNKQLNQKCLDEVIARVQEISDPETAGIITAQEIVDIVIERLAPEIYNKGITDAKTAAQNKMLDLETEIELLRQM